MLPRKHTIDGAQLGNMWSVNIVELAYLIRMHGLYTHLQA